MFKMLPLIKKITKKIIAVLPVALTTNERYDRLTKKVLNKVCNSTSNCIDVGSNKGKILEMMLQITANGNHFAFEPIPILYNKLKEKFGSQASILPIALSNKKELSSFNLVLTDMAYSGLQKRAYDRVEKDTSIQVQTDLLDNIISPSTKITLIKIDVEGAELLVLKGAIQTIQNSKPIILFEFGKAGANAYNNTVEEMFQFFTEQIQYHIFTLSDWLQKKKNLSQEEFITFYENDKEYFFLASPK